MTDYCARFVFERDMNSDMVFTITDVWLLFKQVWLLPSNFVTEILYRIDGVVSFLELDCGTGQGVGGAIFSGVVWFIALSIVAGALTPSTSR